MIENGLHPPFVNIDRSVFMKLTKQEKLAANIAKSVWKGTSLQVNTKEIANKATSKKPKRK